MSDLYWFRWWYKGICPDNVILDLQGHVQATDIDAAGTSVEAICRAEYPRVRWMQGREIEGLGMTFGPTVQKMKRGPR